MDHQKPRLLVADDEQLFIQLMQATLSDKYDLHIVENGEDALAVASKVVPDLILLDVVMPPTSGFEVCQALKDNPKTQRIPILFITAASTPQDEIRGLDLGAVDYITKPINPAVVKARVRNHVDLKQYKDRLERIAAEDMLTGLATRRRFDDVLESEWRRCRRQHVSLAIAMMDIDFFKPYNDNYGHGAGDECLRKIGGILSDQIRRPADLVARYGGEEFVCVMPDTNLDGASTLAHGMRDAVNAAAMPHDHSNVASHVTMSIGVSACVPGDGMEPGDLMKAADKCLYAAKEDGRNRIEGRPYKVETSHSEET